MGLRAYPIASLLEVNWAKERLVSIIIYMYQVRIRFIEKLYYFATFSSYKPQTITPL